MYVSFNFNAADHVGGTRHSLKVKLKVDITKAMIKIGLISLFRLTPDAFIAVYSLNRDSCPRLWRVERRSATGISLTIS